MSSDLTISTRTGADGTPVLVVAGEIDMTNAGEFGRALRQAGAGAERLVVDLRGVGYLDSAALAVLFGLAARTRLEVLVDGLLLPVLEISGLAGVTTVRS